MYCPILQVRPGGYGSDDPNGLSPCIGRSCAWYDDSLSQCSVRTLCNVLLSLNALVNEAVAKMPTRASFAR